MSLAWQLRGAVLAITSALAAGACTDFSSVDRGVCGNGLLEQGEDCDSTDARCVRCAVTCSVATDCPTTDYVCGVDGLCHAPGGGLAQPHSAGPFQANEFRVTDVDHDGIGDALGVSRTSIVIRHGEATGELGTLDSLVTPTQTGPAALGDLDNDGSLDLTLTTADGLVSYSSTYGELAPIAVNGAITDKATGEALDVRLFFHIAPNVIAGFLVDPASQNMYLLTLDGSNGGNPAAVITPPCSARLGAIKVTSFDADSFEVYNVTKDTDDHFETVVSFVSGIGANRRACVMAIHRNAPAFLQPPPLIGATDITPAGFGSPEKKPILADLEGDTDGCPGIVKQDGGPAALAYYDGSQTNPSTPCSLATVPTTLPPLPDAPMQAVVIGHAPVRPTAFSAASDGLITNEGVYPYFPSGYLFLTQPTFIRVYQTTRNVVRVANGDFNGDGYVDVVLSAAGDQDLDVLFRSTTEPGFNLVRLDTTSEVGAIATGDFDGNGISDIAYAEELGDHVRLSVAFGTPDRPLAPVSVGEFAAIIDVAVLGFPDSVDYLGLADDLFVLQPPATGETVERLTILHGSPQRTMLSYFDPRADAVKGDTVFRGAVIGDFVPSGTPDLHDVLALAPPSPASVGSVGPQVVRAYRVPNSLAGLDGTISTGLTIDGLADCSLSATGRLCLDVAHYVAFPTGPSHDVVIGIDKANAAVMVDPWASTVTATPLAALTAKIPANTTVQSVQVGDVDGDGAADLIAAFAPTDGDGKGAVIVCSMTNGMATSCEDVVPAILEAAATGGPEVKNCFDAAPARISYRDPTVAADASMDLAVACRGDGTSIFRVRRTAGGTTVDRLVNTGEVISGLRAGDVTGDHVDDLLLLEGTAVTSLIVYPQCTSRDAATCHATTTGESP